MTLKTASLALLAASLTLPGAAVLVAQGPPPPGYQRGPEPWENAPPEFKEIQQQGFHDGIEGARKDFQNHRRPDVNNRDEFRHPHVPGYARHDYREAFRRGYQVGVQHIYGGGPR
jgi:ribosome modulation factor